MDGWPGCPVGIVGGVGGEIGFAATGGGGGVGLGGSAGLTCDGPGGGMGGLENTGGFIAPIGKLGGILISGVSGLTVSSIALNGGGVPLGFGGVVLGDEKVGGVVDPENGGLISSAICRRF